MGTDISPGTTLVDGTLVHDADLNALIGNATILATAISAKTLKSSMSLGDELLINDSGTLKKVTGQQIVGISAVPAGCMMDYAGATEPLGWVFCYGQLLNRITYASLFTAIGTTYGAGDGSTTFAVPDCRGRVTAGDDNMGGTAANRITTAEAGFDGKVLGAAGGVESYALTDNETADVPHTHTVPAHTHAGVDHLHAMGQHTHYVMHHGHTYNEVVGGGSGIAAGTSYHLASQTTGGVVAFTATSGLIEGGVTTGAADRSLTTGASAVLTTGNVTAQNGATHINVQPTIIINKIIKT